MRTEFEILTDINRLYMDLSPENISWDGMRSRAQVREAAREIHQQLKKLFKELGREVDDYEVMQELRALRGRRSAKQTMRRSASEVIRNLEVRVARLERQATSTTPYPRLASTNKVAGHIILADTVNVRQLRRDLEDTLGIFDIEMEDGVLTFLMSIMDNKQVEKQVKAIAQKHDVKFEKGDFTGLGMIYTKNASRRNRMR